MSSNTHWIEQIETVSILGAGVTGQAAVEELSRRGLDLFVSDSQKIPRETKHKFSSLGAPFEEGGHSEKVLAADLIVISPGVPPSMALVQKARDEGIPVLSEIEVAYRLCPTAKIIAVTGTNGKTSTVNLIDALLSYNGVSSRICGNIGTPFIEVLPDLTPDHVVVLEVSSYQLESVECFRPRVAVLLNLSPDHLYRHGTMEKYREVKMRIFQNQTGADWALIPDNLDLRTSDFEAPVVHFSEDEAPYRTLAPHNRKNLAAALKACRLLLGPGFDLETTDSLVQGALDLEHRLEYVDEIGGVYFINDSKATNPDATIAAVEGSGQDVWLLLGGLAKEDGYQRLARKLRDSGVKGVLLFGEDAGWLDKILADYDIPLREVFPSLGDLMSSVMRYAEEGDWVLFSPACASFDSFDGYSHRGATFKELIGSLDSTDDSA
ncbi:MAG: Mur ligase family protein [Candidatus Bipolaricaulota bacterium]